MKGQINLETLDVLQQLNQHIIFFEDFISPEFNINIAVSENFKLTGEIDTGINMYILDNRSNGILQLMTSQSFKGPYLNIPNTTIFGIQNNFILYTRFRQTPKTNGVFCIGYCDYVDMYYIGNNYAILLSYYQSVIPNNFCLITQINSSTAYFYDTGILCDDLHHEFMLVANSVTGLKLYHRNKTTGNYDLVVTVTNLAEIPHHYYMKLGIYQGDQNAIPPADTMTELDYIGYSAERWISDIIG